MADQTAQINGIFELLDIVTEQLIPSMERNIASKLDAAQVDSKVVELVRRETIGQKPLIIEDRRTKTVRKIEGLRHKQFEEVLNDLLDGDNVYMWDASGGGKTFLAEQMAQALGVPFYGEQLSMYTQPSLIMGYMDANGRYVATDYFKAYTQGGLFFSDEYDNGNPNVQTKFNTSLANGYTSFPNGTFKRHEDFYFLAAGNTPMLGANDMFTSRQRADSANRERFTFVRFEYDEVLERKAALQENPNAAVWVDWVQEARKVVKQLNLKLLCTPRASIIGARKLRRVGTSALQIADKVVFKGIDADTRSKILAGAPIPMVNMSIREVATSVAK